MDTPPAPTTAAQRLNWLFAVVAAETTVSDTATTHRPYTTAEVVRAAFPELGPTDIATRVTDVDRFRAGQGDPPEGLSILPPVFGAPEDYLQEADSSAVRTTELQLYTEALSAHGALNVRACRADPAIWREIALASLALIRMLPPEALPSAAARPADSPTDTASHRSQLDPGDLAETPPVSESRWHDPARASRNRTEAQPRASLGAADTMEAMSPGQLRHMCQQLVHDLDLLPPLDPFQLCKRLGSHRRRRIKVIGEDLGGTSSVGHLIDRGRFDLIGYHRDAPRHQQAHVIYHEIIHLIRGHLDGELALICGALLDEDTGQQTHTDTSGQEVPRRQPNLYSDWQEWEAEAGATILSDMSRRRPNPRMITRNAEQAELGIAAAFGLSTDGWL
jgi:hypothetical protein